MKIVKLQQDIIKTCVFETPEWMYYEDDVNIYCVQGYGFYIIPKRFVRLNIETSFRSRFNLNQFIDDFGNTETMTDTHTTHEFTEGKKKVTQKILKNTKGEEVRINQKLCGYFEGNYEFRQNVERAINPVYVVEDGELVGMILPMTIKD